MEEKRLYEEESELPHPWEWVIIIAFSAAIAGFGWLVYMIVPEGPRSWDFGQLPDTPAESIYSTEEPRVNPPAPRQFPLLPEAQRSNPPVSPDARQPGRRPVR